MFNFWPDKRCFGFDIEPLEEPPGFMMHANGPSREGSPGDAIFSLQPGQDVPGLHNFRPPEEFVPGFHLSADGSLPGEVAPLNSDVGGSPSSVGNAWPYLANGMETYNGQDGVPALASDPTQPTYVAPFAALRSASLFSGNPYLNIGNSSLPVGAVSPPSSGLSFAREEPSFSYQMNQNTGSGGALVPEASQVFEGSQAGSDQITNHGIFRVADGDGCRRGSCWNSAAWPPVG